MRHHWLRTSAIDRLETVISTAASSRRLRLALANAHLTRLLNALRDKQSYMHMVSAKSLFAVLAEPGHDQTESRTLKLDRTRHPLPGNTPLWFPSVIMQCQATDMVIAYSAYELETRRGDLAEASLLEAKAKHLFAATGRQYYFTTLGTSWPDIVGDWLEASGRERVVR
ncbi:hypothetical protein PG995_004833 [Apiospora arundinis]